MKDPIERYLKGAARLRRKQENLRRKAARLAEQGGGGGRRRPRHGDDGGADELGELEEERRPRRGGGSKARNAPKAAREELEAEVASVGRDRLRVLAGGELATALLTPGLCAADGSPLAVGDRVVLERRADVLRARRVLPRTSVLSRPDPADPRRERVLAANVELVVVVGSARAPDFRPRLADRMLVAAARGGAGALVCVHKLDLASEVERGEIAERCAAWRAAGVAVLCTSTVSGVGLCELRAACAGKSCVLVGQSGVGKSSLLQVLDPEGRRATGAVRERDGKGRHTTTRSELTLLGDGTRLVDTPGIRAFGLWSIDPRELAGFFPEIAERAQGCRFRDCRHAGEPGCAVAAAVRRGELAPERFDAYGRMLASLAEDGG